MSIEPGRPAAGRPMRWRRNVLPARTLLLLALAAGTASAVRGADWYVLCERATGEVVVREGFDAEKQALLAGPLPGQRTATVWTDEHCPARTCDAQGRCGPRAASASEAASGGWVAGELTSVTLGQGSVGGGASPASRAPAAGLAGPGNADLSPLIGTATAAAKACSFPAALASAEQMTNFDPEHPWYVANHAKLTELAQRQRQTEQLVWQASSALAQEDLKRARELAATAAGSAVSCQTQAVSELLSGIETAIDQRRRARSAANRALAAALLPGLIDLSRAISGTQGDGAPSPALPMPSGVASGASSQAPGGTDPCSFRYEYPSRWSVEPICTCSGYVFDALALRCKSR